MTPASYLFNNTENTEKLLTCNGALKGGTLNYQKRVGDTRNTISLATAGAYIARGIFKESIPFYREYTDNVLRLHPTYHFLTELRRHLSGEVLPEDSNFSPLEVNIYNEYVEWLDGVVKVGETLQAVETIDKWLTDEIMEIEHPKLNRDYTSTHPWMKIDQRI